MHIDWDDQAPSPSTTLRISGVRPCRGSLPRLLLFALMLELAFISSVASSLFPEFANPWFVAFAWTWLRNFLIELALVIIAPVSIPCDTNLFGMYCFFSAPRAGVDARAFPARFVPNERFSNPSSARRYSFKSPVNDWQFLTCTNSFFMHPEGLLVFAFGGPLKAVLSGPCAHGDFHVHQGTLSRRPFSRASLEGFAAWVLELAGAAQRGSKRCCLARCQPSRDRSHGPNHICLLYQLARLPKFHVP